MQQKGLDLLWLAFQHLFQQVIKNVAMAAGEVMDKTIVVVVNRMVQHDRFKKYILRSSRFKAHDENNQCRVGDREEVEPRALRGVLTRIGGAADRVVEDQRVEAAEWHLAARKKALQSGRS